MESPKSSSCEFVYQGGRYFLCISTFVCVVLWAECLGSKDEKNVYVFPQ